jgi:small subunit ribosomal protein S1
MTERGDFAAMMESAQATGENRVAKRLRQGAVVEGTVVQIGKDSIFVDVGTTAEGRIERAELEDKNGEIKVKVGDRLSATVARNTDNGPQLTLSLGRAGGKGQLDVASLENAKHNAIPVEGTVQKAVKGGLEVTVGGVRAFCPASQIDVTFVKDLQPFEGQTLTFRVMEVKDSGRSVVLSRRALLEQARAQAGQEVVARLHVGGDYEGTVQSLQKYGAFIELGGGVEGLVHISELAHTRVERVEDVLSVGEKIMVRVLAIDPADKGPHPKLRLSVRALEQAPRAVVPEAGEILTGTVSKLSGAGVFVETEKGTGLVPARELGIPRGADFRRMFPLGKEVQVVLVNREGASGRLTFSISRVAGVEEEQNYTAFARSQGQRPAASTVEEVGSFGALLRQKLGLPALPPAAPAASAPVPASASNATAKSGPSASAEASAASKGSPVTAPRVQSPAAETRPQQPPTGAFRGRPS